MEHAVYFWAALIGCTLLVLQVVLQVVGLGGDHDVDGSSADADGHAGAAEVHDPAHGTAGNVFFGILSFKTLVAFAGIFGLTGLALERTDLSPFMRIGNATLAGLVAMVAVAYMIRALYGLGASGTVVISNAVGGRAEVYLRIPARGQGRGKVTVEIQGRSLELPAITDGEEIGTGQVVQVLEVVSGETLKVVQV